MKNLLMSRRIPNVGDLRADMTGLRNLALFYRVVRTRRSTKTGTLGSWKHKSSATHHSASIVPYFLRSLEKMSLLALLNHYLLLAFFDNSAIFRRRQLGTTCKQTCVSATTQSSLRHNLDIKAQYVVYGR